MRDIEHITIFYSKPEEGLGLFARRPSLKNYFETRVKSSCEEPARRFANMVVRSC